MKEMLLINKLIAALRTRKEKTFRDEKLLAEIKNNEFENTHWAYKVPFYFKDALDIKYGERVKPELNRKKKGSEEWKENYWSQGILFNFKEGDTIYHQNGKSCIQIKKSIPVSFENGILNKGTVIFYEYSVDENGKYKMVNADNKKHCNQIEFLELLITGDKSKFGKKVF